MTRGTRRLSVATVFVVTLAIFATGCTQNEAAWDTAVLINQSRHASGVRDVHIDDTLVAKAQAWAEHMAATGTVSHSSLTQGVGDDWSVLAENVGWARSVEEMHSLFLDSAAHRANMLNGAYDRVGVGVAIVDGRFYTAQVYAG